MSDKKIYITTPIYYVNDKPHIGHAYTTIAVDVLARHYRNSGKEVFFMTGVDEHGAKIAEAAKLAGKEPKIFVDELANHFENAWKNLNISYDKFFRTTNPKHEKFVQEFIKKLDAGGYIEKRKYEGLYCIGCEKYLMPDELVDGKCPDHKTEPKKQSEENYFFLLTKAAADFNLLERIESGEIEIGPNSRKNEMLGKIKQGLDDVSISRAAVEWGIPYPGDELQTVYVWIDALINYLSAATIYDEPNIWPADLHLMAKDILWFHAIIWPSMLLAVGETTPKKVFAHGFFTIDGQKMSKTIGNVIDPNEIVEKYGADALRYAVLREFPFGEDGDISVEKIAARYQNDLANGLGNLLNRTISMINKYQIDKLQISHSERSEESLRLDPSARPKGYPPGPQDDKTSKLIKDLKFDSALTAIWKEIDKQNKLIDDKKPWQLAKEGKDDELLEVLSTVYQFLSSLALRLSPFMPEIADKMKDQLKTLKPVAMFPRID